MAGFHQNSSDTNCKKFAQRSSPLCAGPIRKSEQPAYSEILLLLVLLAVLAACVTFTHWPALSAQASSFDDEQYLHKNLLVQNPSWNSTWRFLSEVLRPSTVGGYYQPLAMISLMLDSAMGGRPDNLLPFHVTSLCLHVLNTLLVTILLYMLFGEIWPATIVGLLFGVHPMTVEPISWVSERKTLLASFFALWCLILYVRSTQKEGSRTLFGASIAMYVLALMSKPTTTMVPILLLLLDFWPLRRLSKRAFMEKLPLFVIMIIFVFITVISQGRTASVIMPTEYNPMRIPLILCHNIIFYPYKIIWPANLSSHYPLPAHLVVSDPMILAGVIGTCILLPVLMASLRWTRALLTGWLFFFLAILPTMQIVGFTNVIASDKYAYLPSAGLLMILAWLLGRLWPDVSSSLVNRIATAVIILILAVSESCATRRYLEKWQDSERLYQYMLAQAPDAPSLHLNLGNVVLKKERFDEAISHYNKAIAAHPRYMHAHLNLGIALAAAKRYGEAIREYRIVLKLRKNHKEALSRLAYALAQTGQLDEAIAYYNKALQHRRNDPEVLNNLALTLVKKGEIDAAIELYNNCLEINPDSIEVLNNLGNALTKQKKFDQAVSRYKRALDLKPTFAETHYNLGNVLNQMGQPNEAVVYYQKALRLKPDNIDAHCALGSVLAQLEEYDKAAAHFNEAIRLNPDFAQAYYKLGVLFYNQGNMTSATEQFRQVLRIHPRDAQMHCNLGILLAENGNLDEAVMEFRTALQIDPDLAKAREQLEAALAKKAASNPQREGQ
ncbi:MAG: tetratricopeptide repeat protein [Planctomycetota bacterium]|jgi:tetratricopeptide (TPR) repeat protein